MARWVWRKKNEWREEWREDMEWREAVGDAIRNTIFVASAGKEFGIDPERVIVGRAAFVGEDAWARRVLLPLTELDLTKATAYLTERAERVHRLTPPPDKCDDDRNDNLVRDFVIYWARQLQQQPDAQLGSDLASWSKGEVRIIAGIIDRLFNPGPNVARMIAKKKCDPN
jgi:hypothetical protein